MATRRSTLAPRKPPKLPADLMPDVEPLIIDDGAPVDGMYSEKQMRLLTEPLYASWPGPGKKRSFLALANVGLFFNVNVPPVVPDVMLSVDVKTKDLSQKRNNSYFLWEFGKQPEVVIEIVSNKEGEELGEKLITYARIGIPYYVVWDPDNQLKRGTLQSFVLRARQFEENGLWFPEVHLGLTQWTGDYEGSHDVWLRWTDEKGRLIPTGAEKSKRASKRAKQADERAKQADDRAMQADERAKLADVRAAKARADSERLKAKLRDLGVDPESK